MREIIKQERKGEIREKAMIPWWCLKGGEKKEKRKKESGNNVKLAATRYF